MGVRIRCTVDHALLKTVAKKGGADIPSAQTELARRHQLERDLLHAAALLAAVGAEVELTVRRILRVEHHAHRSRIGGHDRLDGTTVRIAGDHQIVEEAEGR